MEWMGIFETLFSKYSLIPPLFNFPILWNPATPAAITALFTAIGGFASDQLTDVCETIEKWFVENRYRVVASDGTILTTIKKDNAAGIAELKKQGIDIDSLTHFTKSGVRMQDEH
jgi:hypothetical protein